MKDFFKVCPTRILKIVPVISAVMLATVFSRAQTNQMPKPPETLAAFQKNMEELIGHTRYASALWGVKIASLDTGKVLFEHNSQKLFSPASNSKLYTMALALDRLGPDYRTKTSLYAQAKPDAQGVLKSDLMVYGRGDPASAAR